MLDYVAAIRSESKAFYDAASGADPEARVPSCPEWSVRDLVVHLAGVHWFWNLIIERGITDLSQLEGVEEPQIPESFADCVALGREFAEKLTTTLAGADQSKEVWSWSTQHDVAFTTRHQVQEAAIHRWDLEDAVGDPSPIPPDIADDSIDEFLRISLPSRNEWKRGMDIVHVHATDTGRDWLLEPSGTIEDRGGSADVTISATASDILLALYGRIELEGIDSIVGGVAFT